VSSENGRTHRGLNENQENEVQHYKLDGDLVKQEKCCDYLLLNNTRKYAYFIELKGGNVGEAAEQLECGIAKVQSELKGYVFYLRIIASKVRTMEMEDHLIRKLKKKYGGRLVYKSVLYEEKI
jgi:hypothetical protein